VFVLASAHLDAPCEIREIIHFFHAERMSATEIHRDLCSAIYSQNVMSEGTVRQ
jgi:hypothetical protein